MKKIIIKYEDNYHPTNVMYYISRVIKNGLISTGAKGKKHYCFISTFNDGTVVEVSQKYNTESDIFTVYYDKNRDGITYWLNKKTLDYKDRV